VPVVRLRGEARFRAVDDHATAGVAPEPGSADLRLKSAAFAKGRTAELEIPLAQRDRDDIASAFFISFPDRYGLILFRFFAAASKGGYAQTQSGVTSPTLTQQRDARVANHQYFASDLTVVPNEAVSRLKI
jgi:hypothetical protein